MIVVKNKLYQAIQIIVNGSTVSIPPKTEKSINMQEPSEQLINLNNKGFINYKKA